MNEHEEALADLAAQYSSISGNLWSVYAATTVVLIGLSLAGVVQVADDSLPAALEASVRGAVTIGFGFFSYGNFILLLDANRVLLAIRDAIVGLPGAKESGFGEVLSKIADSAHPLMYVPIYHFSIDACVLAALWVPFGFRLVGLGAW